MLDRFAASLSELHAVDQLRTLTTGGGIPLGSNDYLGLSNHPRLREAICRAAGEDLRLAGTGSRLLSGNHERWEELEQAFAEFVGAEAALYFTSGYAANVGLLSCVLKPDDTVFSDASNHASLIDGIRLSRARKVVFPHADLAWLEDALRRSEGSGAKVVVVESIFSMEGDRAPLAELTALCERFDAYLIVDEAHAVGVEGAKGRGLVQERARVLARVYPCGKALASMGAFVAGSRALRDYLINHARPFIFSTAFPPYCAAHVSEAIALVQGAEEQRRHLRELSQYARSRLREAEVDIGTSSSHIVPVILGTNERALSVAAALTEAGFAIRAIRPPTVPTGTSRLRLSLNAGLTVSDIDGVIKTVCSGGL